MARKISVAALGLLVVVAALLLVGEYVVLRRSRETCTICKRHISPQAGVVADIGGRRQRVCCAHCAVVEGLQEKKPVRLIEVTDYRSGRKLDPQRAWYVDGSRVNVCTHDMARMSEMKQVQQTTFDRCSPGTLAFPTRAEADVFAATNGGIVRDLDGLLVSIREEEQ